jgi:hypothetical protein
MNTEQESQGLFYRMILSTFAACWVFGLPSMLLAVGMGFEFSYSTSNKKEVADRVVNGFSGALVGLTGGFMGILAYFVIVKTVLWVTGIEIGDVHIIRTLEE